MSRIELGSYAVSTVLLLLFVSNLLVGAAGTTGFMEDVDEALVLFGVCVSFVIGVLLSERRVQEGNQSKPNISNEEKSQNVK